MEEVKPIDVDDDNFEEEVLKSNIPVLVDFWAPWCGACHKASPVVERVAQEYQGRLKVCKLNVDKGQQVAIRYGIMSIPTLNIYKDGNVVDQIIGVGATFETDLRNLIERHI